jgi:signal transduction histidine kinase
MNPLADAAGELPWLSPCADSLASLARGASAAVWPSLRTDPGLVLLLLRAAGPAASSSALPFYTALLHEPAALSLALDGLGRRPSGFVDWSGALAPVYRSAQLLGRAAEALALRSDRSDPEHAFVAGLLAPLGWLAAAATDPTATAAALQEFSTPEDAARLQHRRWGLDAAALARRLAKAWALPPWLSAVVGHLALPVEVAATLGADPDRFLIVQLAAALVEQAGYGLHLRTGVAPDELRAALDLPVAAVEEISAQLPDWARAAALPASWSAPASLALLPDLLTLALDHRRRGGRAVRAALHAEVDALHDAVARQKRGAAEDLREHKVRALAELAAGAGHEINNPLAVISGQAQYLLCSEAEPGRRKALQTIVGQTQRIHQVLTGLMQFARPPAPQREPVDLEGLVRDVLACLQDLADERQVRLQGPEPVPSLTLNVDPGQMRTVLSALVRNAIEAAPAAGWARLQIGRTPDDGLAFVIEDSGPGPTATDREHLFDPFYSGRKAGRGRGLGLPTAWQLARQHHGDVRFEGGSPTRFVLELPAEAVSAAVVPLPAVTEVANVPALGLLPPGANGIPAHG